jgi:glycosyltransferase involved in cell wall biosynthesis
MFPGAYSFWERLYMKLSIRFSVRVASRVVAVSENTKRDLMKLYGVPEEKMTVVYEGVSENVKAQMPNPKSLSVRQAGNPEPKVQKPEKPYLLFIGRLEERKNVVRIIEAFEILKQEKHIPHELVLVGKPGCGYEKIKNQKSKIKNRDSVIELGYVGEEEKQVLLRGADVLLFPTLYEGFGLPVIEAQAVGVPVVTSDTSSLPEIAGSGAVFVDPMSVESIVAGTLSLLSEGEKRSAILEKGLENARRFSWKQCAVSIAAIFSDTKKEKGRPYQL